MRMLRMGLVIVVSVLATSCGGGDATGDAASDTTATDTLTRAQKDSIAARSGLPGSRGVGRAMDAVGDANARSAAHDSLLNQ